MKTALPLWKPNARLCNKENIMYQKLTKIWAGLLFCFIALLLPLYIPKNGYYDIGEEKFKFFLCGMSILTLVGMLLFLFAVFQKKKVPFHFNSMDIFAILFACFCSVSFFFSGHKDIALIGNEEWYMGLISQLLFVCIYFGVSAWKNKMSSIAVIIIKKPQNQLMFPMVEMYKGCFPLIGSG